jgi:hypothetical protein
MLKRLVLSLAVAALAVAAGNSYTVRLYQTASIGGAEFKPGEVKLDLTDNKVVLKQGKTTAAATASVQSSTTKFSSTTVDTSDGRIREIRLGGTTTKLVFEDTSEAKAATR